MAGGGICQPAIRMNEGDIPVKDYRLFDTM